MATVDILNEKTKFLRAILKLLCKNIEKVTYSLSENLSLLNNSDNNKDKQS